jgi:hypothetical protein
MAPGDDDGASDATAGDDRAYRSEPYLNTSEVPSIDIAELRAAAGMDPEDDTSGSGGGSRTDDGGDGDGDGTDRPGFTKRHPKLTIAAIIVIVLMIYPAVTYAQALRKEGNESLEARTAEWARDMKLGFLVDRAEQVYYSKDQYADGGAPDANAIGPVTTSEGSSSTTEGGGNGKNSTTAPKPTIPHTPAPGKLASPVATPIEGEGDWAPVGPLTDGVAGVYTTKVRPNDQKTSLLVFVAWVDPKLTNIKLFPGTDLPGGTWNTPHFLTPELCSTAIIAMNGGFRMDQARGGYYAEGREPFPLRNGAASLVFFKDGHVDVGQWGRDFTKDDLPNIESVRQNLELMVDNGQPVPGISSDKDWGALLPNSYFVWRSGYGVTKDGALVYAGGPALQPGDLARTLINAGAVRVMEGDINPEWVSAHLYANEGGKCKGTKALTQSQDKGGMRQPDDRYLTTDTRDFVAVFSKPPATPSS